ncbi:MAG: hypothetical protein ACE5FO_05200 [Parvularculaceae bacterium]
MAIFAWWSFGRQIHEWAYAPIDLALAIFFWRMSRGHWFPVPLFFVHALQVLYYPYAALIDVTPWWLAAFLNRIFEAEIAYILVCAIYRIVRMRKLHPE